MRKICKFCKQCLGTVHTQSIELILCGIYLMTAVYVFGFWIYIHIDLFEDYLLSSSYYLSALEIAPSMLTVCLIGAAFSELYARDKGL